MPKKLWIILGVIIVLCLGGGLLTAFLTGRKEVKEVVIPPVIKVTEVTEQKQKAPAFQKDFLTATEVKIEPYSSPMVKAQLKPYTIKPDLSNVVNLKQFGEFIPAQKKLLAKNGFVVVPTDEIQLYHIYERNSYLNIPSFITTDSVLQTYHIFYDYTLRTVEFDKLHDLLEQLAQAMLTESKNAYEQISDPKLKQAALKNIAYFAVASKLLELKTDIPASAKSMVNKELELIEAHHAREKSAIFPFDLEYTQFNPRGHYTRNEKFKKYFKAMMWYGLVPFPVPGEGFPSTEPTQQALLITYIIFNTKIGKELTLTAWDKIYEPTVFYVGSTDDLNPYEYKQLMDEVYGKDIKIAQLADSAKLAEFINKAKKLRPPGIKQFAIGIPTGLQFRFMGQRYIPDSEMLQELCSWPKRAVPKGLDVMAVLGSVRAYAILDKIYEEPKKWDKYTEKMTKLKDKFGNLSLEKWQSNLYYGWLWCLKSLLDVPGKDYPSFMTNQAWLDKSLDTALGSWAELRHDTILYAKQSVCEMGGEPPPMIKGYVEPNVEFYACLERLTKISKEGLSARRLLIDKVKDKFEEFEELLLFLKEVSIKELTNQKLTREEYDQIRIYGAELERITTDIAGGELLTETDKDIAVIADVHTSGGSCLEEAVGHANEIYVIVPVDGKLQLTRGAVFSYYEFVWPTSDRLTDEKWQQMLKEGKQPDLPIWVKSFITGKKRELPEPRKVYSSGC